MRKLILFIALIIGSTTIQAQDLESEVGYLYTKAKYLLETDRSAEAEALLTKIIKIDAHYKEAMALRAEAKNRMGNTPKARKDIIRYIEENGLTPNAVKTLALINYAEKDYTSAANSLYTASLLFPREVELLEKRAEVLMKNGQTSEGCVAWHDAAKLGSKMARSEISKNCEGNSVPDRRPKYDPIDLPNTKKNNPMPEDPSEKEPTGEPETTPQSSEEDPSSEEETKEETKEEEAEEVEESYEITEIDTTDGKNKWLKLDEELSVNILGGGLGDRKIKSMPNILLLTDAKGTIVVDIYVDKNGDVKAAELNGKESTMNHRNNAEYLLRKTKDLKFNTFSKAKCGRIIYNINE